MSILVLPDAARHRAAAGVGAALAPFAIGLLAVAVVVWAVHRQIVGMPTGSGWIDTYAYLDAVGKLFHSPAHLYDAARSQLTAVAAQRAFLYPPSALIPFVVLEPIQTAFGTAAAASVWVIADGAALIMAVLLLCRSARLGRWNTSLVLLLACGSAPTLLEIGSGQVNGLLLLLVALAIRDAGSRREALWLGLAIALKPVAPLLLLVPLCRGRYQNTLVAAAIAAGLNILMLPLVGFANEWFYLTVFLPFLSSHVVSDLNNLSPSNALQVLIGGRLISPSDPVAITSVDGAALAGLLGTLVRFTVAGLAAVAMRRARTDSVAIAIALAVAPLIAATAWGHYYILLLPLLIVELAVLQWRSRLYFLGLAFFLAFSSRSGGLWLPRIQGGMSLGTLLSLLHSLIFVAACWGGVIAVVYTTVRREREGAVHLEEAA